MVINKKYAIRKLAVGVASVAIGFCFIGSNVQAATNSNEVSYTNSTTDVYRLDSSENTINLHEWIKEKIKTLDFSNLTRDEFYGLVSEDGKTYGDVRKVVSDWKDAKLPQGNYTIKKLTIVDISEEERKSHQTVEEKPLNSEDGVFGYGDLNDTPLSKIEKIVDKENNNEIKPLFYSIESISGDNLENPVFLTPEELAEKYKNTNPNYNWGKYVLYKGELSIPYGNRNLKTSYLFNSKHEIGTKTKVEFVGDKIKVRTRKLVLKDKIVDEHNNIQNFEIIENNYQLDDEPRKIVKETPDMKIDDDPGILSAIPDGHEPNNEIKKLQSKRKGYVFKVKSYEEDGTTSYRYFRTWTTLTNEGRYATTIAYDDSETDSKLRDDLKTIEYVNDDTLEYSKIKHGSSFAYEIQKNVTYLRWEVSEPTPNSNNTYVETYTPILADDKGVAETFKEYPDTPPSLLNVVYKNYLIGTKPEVHKEMVETRRTKYIANENLDTTEKVIQDGKDKFKVSKTIYTLVKNTAPREDVEGLFENDSIEAKEVTSNYPNIPSLTNGGVTKEITITYEEAEDRIIEKKVNKPKTEVTVIPKTIKYIKDGNREVGTPDEITQGKDGSKTTTTTYEVNENTGEVIEHKGEPVIVAPVPTVVSVGAKDKVIVKDRTDGAKEKETTKYDVDKDTGKLTENVTTELLSSKGNEAPPVVQPEEFTGGVNGTDAPVSEELPVLKVGIIKDIEGNVIDVIKVDEEPKEIEGYTNTGKVETDKDGNKVYIYEKVKQEKQKEEPKEINTENPVVEKEANSIKKETNLPKTNPVQGTAEMLGLLLGATAVIKSRKRK